MIRSFIAINIENSEALNQIFLFQKMLKDVDTDIKLVNAGNIHITLRFLGEIPLKLVNRIGVELNTLHFRPFKASLNGVGAFPTIKRINVIWIGIEKGNVEIINIHNKVEAILKRLGILPNHRGFSPHVTIARVRSAKNKNKIVKVLLTMQKKEFGIFPVSSVNLKESVLTPKGPIYTTLTKIKADNIS